MAISENHIVFKREKQRCWFSYRSSEISAESILLEAINRKTKKNWFISCRTSTAVIFSNIPFRGQQVLTTLGLGKPLVY